MFVITNEDMTEFVGLDQASGGYPYVSNRFVQAHFYFTKEDAQKEIDNEYLSKFLPRNARIARVNLELI